MDYLTRLCTESSVLQKVSVVSMNGTVGAVIQRRLWLIMVDVMPLVADGPSGVCAWSDP